MPGHEPNWEFKSDSPLRLRWNAYEPTQVLTDGNPIKPELSELVLIERKFNPNVKVEVETIRLNSGILVRIPSSSKEKLGSCQDAASVGLDQQGEINAFSIADGISKAVNSKAVAEQAVALAITKLRNRMGAGDMSNEAMKVLLLSIEEKMQVIDVDALEAIWAQDMDRQGARPFTLGQLGYTKEGGQLVKSNQKRSGDYGLGSATLIMGSIENGALRIANLGDGGFMVLSKNGVKFVYEGTSVKGRPSQIDIEGIRIKDTEIYLKEIQLAVGDVVLAYTDGLYHKGTGIKIPTEERVAYVIRALKQGQTIEQIIKALLFEAGGSDDTTVLGFEYKG